VRNRLLPSLLILPALLGLRGCDDPVDLGNNVDAGTIDVDAGGRLTCDFEDCGDPPPPLGCVDGRTAYTCEPATDADGSCAWVYQCPDEGEECVAGACTALPPDPDACALGAESEGTGRCVVDSGSCEWETRACEPTECSPDDCGEPPPPFACVDGSVPYHCGLEGGECTWITDECPDEGDECREGACGELPPGLSCEMGAERENTGRCILQEGTCDWEYRDCSCELEDCGDPPPGVPCPDGSNPYVCERAVDADGSCAWARSCPGPGELCDDPDEHCGPLPPGLPCGGGALTEPTGQCVVREDESGCEWGERSCECDESECVGERPVDDACGDSPSHWCGRQPDSMCIWEAHPDC